MTTSIFLHEDSIQMECSKFQVFMDAIGLVHLRQLHIIALPIFFTLHTMVVILQMLLLIMKVECGLVVVEVSLLLAPLMKMHITHSKY